MKRPERNPLHPPGPCGCFQCSVADAEAHGFQRGVEACVAACSKVDERYNSRSPEDQMTAFGARICGDECHSLLVNP